MLQLFAGAARVKTTPPLGTRINGDFITHYATYIHDDVYSKSLILRHGVVTVALVVVDICILPKEFLDAVKAEITELTGIPGSHILISSTHTHAAGSVADVHLGSVDPAYERKLSGLIVESVQVALSKLKPAQIAFGSVYAPEHLLCRRYHMHAEYSPFNPVTGKVDQVKTNPFGAEEFIIKSVANTDPELGYLAVKGLDDSWISILGNYSLHYVGDWENGTISADYFGVFSERLAEKLDVSDEFVAMMSNGTSGDVNIWDFLNSERYPKEHFQKSALIGADLADRVLANIDSLRWQTEASLDAVLENVALDIVKPTAEELEKAASLVAKAHFETIQADLEGLQQIYAREQLLLNEMDPTRICPVQAIRIGDGVIGALAGEFFSETGLYLKKHSPVKNYFTITMANGNAGYVPPAEEISKGGYETWRCRYSCLVPGSEGALRNSLLTLIGQVIESRN